MYGVRAMWRRLRREGVAVANLMRELDLRGVVRARRVKTTTLVATLPCPAGRVNRLFKAPHTKWSQEYSGGSTTRQPTTDTTNVRICAIAIRPNTTQIPVQSFVR